MKYAPYSYSRISTYQQCPKKFKYRYVDKIKTPFVYSEPLIKGGCLHDILEKYPEPSAHKHQAKYQSIADTFINSEVGRELFSRESVRELDIGLTKNLEICEYSDKDAMFRGSVDYFTMKNNYLWIVDYKSGKFKEAKYQTFDQNMWYALYFFIKYPKLQEIKITYQYIEHDLDHTMILFREFLDDYKRSLIQNIIKIETDEAFDANIGPLCDWCDYQKICEKASIDSYPNDFLIHLI